MIDSALQVCPIDQYRPLPSNPRKNHRISGLIRSMSRLGFGAPLVGNADTGHLVAGEGRRKALRKMKRQGMAPPAGISVIKGKWAAPTWIGHWSAGEESELALALNGGLNGSLEGDLDEAVLAEIFARADDETAAALNLQSDDLAQFLADYEAPVAPPAIALDGLETLEHVSTGQLTTLKLIIPEELGRRARKLTARGITPADLLLDGIAAHEQAPTKSPRGKATPAKAKRRAPRKKNPPRSKGH